MNNGVLFTINKEMFQLPFESGCIRIYQVGENIMERGSEIYPHIQRCCEISYVASGEADFYADGRCTKLSKGDIQIISGGCEHRIAVGNSSRLRYLFLGFDIVPFDGTGAELKDFFDSAKGVVIKDSGAVSSIFNSFVNELCYDSEYSRELYGDYAKILLVNIFRCCRNINKKSFEADRQLLGGTVFAVMKYIDANIMTVTRVSDIAENLNYSAAYISRVFKQKMGINIKEYLDECKIEKAKQLLAEKTYKINEISSVLGFEDYSGFCKKFRKLVGCSPTDFLRKLDKNF
ncbi:MAG: helix-turn-helix domain-containing protein [Clostridia bacterium]|nr:helix-turn-helix domain-containing protein [Clostridia bacterium]